jgi:hypothetical protein
MAAVVREKGEKLVHVPNVRAVNQVATASLLTDQARVEKFFQME